MAKRVWVTGASGTIGGAIAARFRQEGASVFTDRVEVTDYTAVLNGAWESCPDILVNCVGYYMRQPISVLHCSPVDWKKAVDVNLTGCFYLTKAVLPYMNRGGKIIHMSGGGAAYGRPFYSDYASSKAGLVRFVECVAGEVEQFDIQINAIAPGSVKSRMNPEGTETPDKAVELVMHLCKPENKTTGRLISAIHDDWTKPFLGEAGLLRRVKP